MTKDDRGVWTVMLGPFPPNIWTYNFVIDGTLSNKRMHLLWFAVGDQEKRLMARNQEFSALLEQHGITHTFVPTPGWSHQVQLWRQNLHDFARLLFSR